MSFRLLPLVSRTQNQIKKKGNQAECRKENVRSKADVGQHPRRHQTNDEVAHPRGTRGYRYRLRAVAEIEDFRRQNPADRRERVGEIDILNVHESNTGPASSFVGNKRRSVGADDTADNDEGHHRSNGSRHEKLATSDLVDQNEC